jgi:hypothetical protein
MVRNSRRSWKLLCAMALTITPAMALVVPNSVEASPGTWTVSSSPDQPGPNSAGFQGISCSGSFCMAVGDRVSNADVGSVGSLAETWDGAKWSIVSTPNPKGGRAVLASVSCTSSAFCVSVGYHFVNLNGDRSPLGVAEIWNGITWSKMTNPRAGVSQMLTGVSCGSPSYCVAVGYYTTSNDRELERWIVVRGVQSANRY